MERIQERAISLAEVVEAIMHGEIIEVYSDDRPHPSCLIYRRSEEPVHVVAAADPVARVAYVVTAYRPSLAHFEKDLKTRRRES